MTTDPSKPKSNDNAQSETRTKTPPPTFSRDPEEELEQKVRAHPDDCDAKVDVGSDESMDASDPISVTRPQDSQPAPSSGFPEDDDADSSNGGR